MRLNMHILQADLGDLCSYVRTTESTALNLLGVKFLGPLAKPPEPDILYIGSKAEAEKCAYLADVRALIVTGECDPDEIESKTTSDFIITAQPYEMNQVFNRIQDVFDAYNRWDSELMEMILHGRNLKYVLEKGREIIQNPLALFDINMICLATTGEELVDPEDVIWKDVLTKGHVVIDMVPLLRKDKANVYDKIQNSRESFLYELKEIHTKCLHANIYRGEKKIGCICLTENIAPLTKKSCSIANHLGEMLSAVLEHPSLNENSFADIEQLGIRLFEGKVIEDEYLRYVLAGTGWKSEDVYRVYAMAPMNETLLTEQVSNLYYFQNLIPNSRTFRYQKHIIAVQNCGAKVEMELGNDGLPGPVRLVNLLDQIDYYCGASEVFSSFYQLPRFYNHACIALDLGYRRDPRQRLFVYPDLIMEHMADVLVESHDLIDFCHPKILALYQKDIENKTHLVESLLMFLSTGKNLVETAKKLFIHRNTFVYRLGKIQDIIGKEFLDDENNTLALHLSCWLVVHHLSSEALTLQD